jgi:protein-S-isoprenylcysteine O-methyltransferase Ste14
MSIRRDFPDIPPVWGLGIAFAQWVVASLVPTAWLDRPATGWAALGLGLAGLVLALWSLVWFAKRRTDVEPRGTPTTLIVEGPFRLNRNPIYSGMALMLLAWGFWLESLPAAAFGLLFIPIVTSRFVLGEEETLRRAFGPDADAYIAATRRW